MFLPGTRMQNWIKGKCSVSVRHQCFTATFQSDTIEKKLEDGWRELVEEDESRYSNRELKRRGNRTRKRGNGGFAGVTVTVMQPLRSLTLHHQDLQAQHCVCACACSRYSLSFLYWQEDPVCSVSPSVPG